MELLYFVDRTITRTLQALSKQLSTRAKLSLGAQMMIIRGLGAILYISSGVFSDSTFVPNFVMTTIRVFTAALGWPFIVVGLALVLVLLHHFFDPDGFHLPDKEFSSGYFAWALFVVWGILFVWYWAAPLSDWTYAQLICIEMIIPVYTYESFVERTSSNRRKGQRKVMSQVLEKLLEHCRNWLPQPQPAAG